MKKFEQIKTRVFIGKIGGDSPLIGQAGRDGLLECVEGGKKCPGPLYIGTKDVPARTTTEAKQILQRFLRDNRANLGDARLIEVEPPPEAAKEPQNWHRVETHDLSPNAFRGHARRIVTKLLGVT